MKSNFMCFCVKDKIILEILQSLGIAWILWECMLLDATWLSSVLGNPQEFLLYQILMGFYFQVPIIKKQPQLFTNAAGRVQLQVCHSKR